MSVAEINAEMVKRVLNMQGTFTRIEKVNDKPFVIGGYASVLLEDEMGREMGDLENDSVTLEALDEGFGRMMKRASRRNLNSYHTHVQIGEILTDYTDSDNVFWKSQVVYTPNEQYKEKGLFILAEVFDDMRDAKLYREAMTKDHMLAFSIGGQALGKKTVCHTSNECFNQITYIDLFEVSSCEKGMNPKAKATIMKRVETNPLLEVCNSGEELLKKLRV